MHQLISETGMLGLEPERRLRDEAEHTLHQLITQPTVTEDDRLNASFSLIQLAQRRGDHASALEQLGNLVVDEASEAKWNVIFLRAISLSQIGSHSDAATLFDVLLEAPKEAQRLISGFWELEAGRTYSHVGRNEDAARVTRNAASFFKAKDDLLHLTRAESNLAILKLESEDAAEVAEAEKVLEHICDIKISIGDAEGASTNFSQLSNHYFLQGRFEKAIAYGRRDLKLSRFVGDDRMIAITLGNLASIYIGVLQLSEARKLTSEAADIGKRLNNPDILAKTAVLGQTIKAVGTAAGKKKIDIGKKAVCACKSGKQYVDCCGRADHEPVDLSMEIGPPSEDVNEIRDALKVPGLNLLQLDYALRETQEARRRFAWTEMRGHDGWFEIFELPDMANMHLSAAEAFAAQAKDEIYALQEPIACVMLGVSALEAFINSTVYFAKEAADTRALVLPPALLSDPFDYQRHTELTQKWNDLGTAICVSWPPPGLVWTNFITLVQLRNELVHYKSEGFERVAPRDTLPPKQLRNLPPEIELRDVPHSWPVRLLTPSLARWSVQVAKDLISHFRKNYRYAPIVLRSLEAPK